MLEECRFGRNYEKIGAGARVTRPKAVRQKVLGLLEDGRGKEWTPPPAGSGAWSNLETRNVEESEV